MKDSGIHNNRPLFISQENMKKNQLLSYRRENTKMIVTGVPTWDDATERPCTDNSSLLPWSQLGFWTDVCPVDVTDMSSLLTGAKLDFLFLGKKKQHSEKTEETQLNPNHLVFLAFLLKSH